MLATNLYSFSFLAYIVLLDEVSINVVLVALVEYAFTIIGHSNIISSIFFIVITNKLYEKKDYLVFLFTNSFSSI